MPRRLLLLLIPLLLLALALLAWLGPHAYRYWRTRTQRFPKLGEWFDHYPTHPDWTIQGGTRCGDSSFLLPTTGYVGFLWDDSFNFRQRHQGIDIFSPDEPGVTPVVAAYSGYLTRRPDWKSTLAIRVPSDPLQPGRQIWLYYTHMALPDGTSLIDAAYPPAGAEVFVDAGTVLGAQGNYSGYPGNPTGVHLHFSIVLDDGEGSLRNELEFRNTLDPSPYLGLEVNAGRAGGDVPVCAAAP